MIKSQRNIIYSNLDVYLFVFECNKIISQSFIAKKYMRFFYGFGKLACESVTKFEIVFIGGEIGGGLILSEDIQG